MADALKTPVEIIAKVPLEIIADEVGDDLARQIVDALYAAGWVLTNSSPGGYMHTPIPLGPERSDG